MKLLIAFLAAAIALCSPVVASEVGSYPNATTLIGNERLLADQALGTVNITPLQIQNYIFSPITPYSVLFDNNGIMGGVLPATTGTYCLSWTSLTLPPILVTCPSATGFAFNLMTGGTNVSAAMLVGTGSSLGPTDSGTVSANAYIGVLPYANGGTNATTATQAALNLLPTLVNGECLGNNGTAILWVTCGTGGGGSGTVNSGTGGYLGYYAVTGTAISPLAITSTTLADLGASTAFTVAGTGCTATVTHAGPYTGIITLASGPCTSITITINGATGFSANYGFHCTVSDITQQAAGTWIPVWGETSSTTHTAVIPVPPASATTDQLSVDCGNWY